MEEVNVSLEEEGEEEMRLRESLKTYAGEVVDGANAEIVEQILGTAERKRARPSSSLDVKVDNGSELTRPPTPKEAPPIKQITRNAPSPLSRAQGGGGIPKRRYELPDLAGMSEEELLKALYDDPELAAEAAAAAEKIQKPKKSHTPRSSRPKQNRSVPVSKRADKYPAHLKAMMDDGVPVKQWIIVLLLLAAGLYQLRKVLVGPTRTKNKTKRHARQVKKGKKVPRGKANKSQAAPLDDIPDIVIEQEVAKPKLVKKAASKKKKNRNKQAATKRTAAKEQKPKDIGTHDSPDSISTDGSSSTDGVRDTEQLDLAPAGQSVVIGNAIPEETVINDDGWQTVGSKGVQPQALSKREETAKIEPASSTESPAEGESKVDELQSTIDEAEDSSPSPDKVASNAGRVIAESPADSAEAEEEAQEVFQAPVHEVSADQTPPGVDSEEEARAEAPLETPTEESAEAPTETPTEESAESPTETPAESDHVQTDIQEAQSGNLEGEDNASNHETTSDKSAPLVEEPSSTSQDNKPTETSQAKEDAAKNPAVEAPDTTNDEELAKKLQLEEEETLARIAAAAAAQEESWAEVPVKRKKKAT